MAVFENMTVSDKIIEEYIPLVKYIASRVVIGKSRYVEYEDLVSYGIIGLLDAINKFDNGKGVKFSTYASIRIKGAILDELRKNSPLPKNALDKLSQYNSAVEKLQNILSCEPTENQIADELNISLSEVIEIEGYINYLSVTSLDDLLFSEDENKTGSIYLEDRNSPDPIMALEENEKLEYLKLGLQMISEKDRNILSLYFNEGLTMKEIGYIYGISESRVCQINSRAILNLRNAMKSLKYDFKE
ncbi:MAG: FliA/WhiG family RNA polymerase sigma factor [Bacillota bacterium]|nr:FliA/WhiG family RNA polymerase sigma factor [Bacillota bacterium]